MKVSPRKGQPGSEGFSKQPYMFQEPFTVDAGYNVAQLDDVYAKEPPMFDPTAFAKGEPS